MSLTFGLISYFGFLGLLAMYLNDLFLKLDALTKKFVCSMIYMVPFRLRTILFNLKMSS